jgi:Reverse transcriptase (RNA-dependent DNA polymerase).
MNWIFLYFWGEKKKLLNMNQSFSSQQLIKLCKETELDSYGKTALLIELDSRSKNIIEGNSEFEIKKAYDFYLTDNLCDTLIIRKLNDNIKRIYKDEQANRRIIIDQVKTLLEETCPFWILKTDIKSFYESIDRDRLIEKLKKDTILSFHSIKVLNKILSNSTLAKSTGLPRGLSISSTLSEIYMRKFDNWIKTSEGVFYYARFVDDIIIFSFSKEKLELIRSNLNAQLKVLDLNLEINEKKTPPIYDGRSIRVNNPLEYLGYSFTKENKNVKLAISIANKKVNKIKIRIIKALCDFIKTNDFVLLEKRIKFLTGNYCIKKGIDGKELRAGIHYNYPQVTDFIVFDELNMFLSKSINCRKGSLGIRISKALSKPQKMKLSGYSFKHGFLNKEYHSFTFDEMKQIISCWKNGKSKN